VVLPLLQQQSLHWPHQLFPMLLSCIAYQILDHCISEGILVFVESVPAGEQRRLGWWGHGTLRLGGDMQRRIHKLRWSWWRLCCGSKMGTMGDTWADTIMSIHESPRIMAVTNCIPPKPLPVV
jgi:hypothetical protein